MNEGMIGQSKETTPWLSQITTRTSDKTNSHRKEVIIAWIELNMKNFYYLEATLYQLAWRALAKRGLGGQQKQYKKNK